MKKMLLKPLGLTLIIVCILSLGKTETFAQCKYSIVNVKNDTTSLVVTCDFPVKANTGDSTLDQNNFIAALLAWSPNLPTINTTGIKDAFFTISAADFELFTEEKKNALKVYPQLYQVSQ
jgi:hypothetical protein